MDLQIQFPRISLPILPPISLRSPDLALESENHSSAEPLLCQTPRSEKNRIPQLKSPPPAPRKKRQHPMVFKRKLKLDLDQFFEIVNGSEVDEFFRSGFEFASTIAKRNKCAMT